MCQGYGNKRSKIISWHQPQENQLKELERGGGGVVY